MDLDSDIEVVIGPYEVYEDELFNYKASFEVLRLGARQGREREARRLREAPARHGEEPADPGRAQEHEPQVRVAHPRRPGGLHRRRRARRRADLGLQPAQRRARPAGEGLEEGPPEERHGGEVPREPASRSPSASSIRPSSPRSRSTPTSTTPSSTSSRTASGPAIITGPDGKKVEARLLLKNLYSTIEECKADVVGMWTLLQAIDRQWLTAFDENTLGRHDVGAAVPLDPLRRRRGARRRHGGPVELVPREGRRGARRAAAASGSRRRSSARRSARSPTSC